ncbi:peptidase inhibitor family I36 protein [Streptomyces indicus]|uniref:Peptidase inhibitor family I36 n=1 Tax=Streptomyces indicus TaxID=417292 RepID=A0A1G8V0Q2_9ACTN|nr:peptidase inhibitor family I36 protein [Streptomyces indicus]SDJ59676.1 Peptidase inhibitor family I36 [Streptomyces indicus]
MKRPVSLLAALLLAAGGALATASHAGAADCPSGEFCAWTEANYGGQRMNASGDDGWWESYIADEDSSWANHGISGPGVKDHVQVYERSTSHPLGRGDMTICLRPGDEVGYNATANDRGDSHTWAMGC